MKLTFSTIMWDNCYVWKNISWLLHQLIKTYSNVYICFIQEISIINKLGNPQFFVRHNWQVIELGFPRSFDTIEYLMEKLMLLRFYCQIYFASSVTFSYFLSLKSLVWFLYLSLKSVSAKSGVSSKTFCHCLHH